MAFVAIARQTGALLGVARFVADPDYTQGEYAILLRSDLKGLGLGWRLMQHLIAYARSERLERAARLGPGGQHDHAADVPRTRIFRRAGPGGDAGVRRVVLPLTAPC